VGRISFPVLAIVMSLGAAVDASVASGSQANSTSAVALTLRGSWRVDSEGRQAYSTWLVLSVPFEPFVWGSASWVGLAADEAESPDRSDPAPSEPGPAAEASAPVHPAPLPPAPEAAEAPRRPARRKVPTLAPGFARRTVRAALRAARAHATLQRLEGLESRSRMSAVLPEARFRAGRSVDESLRLSPTMSDPYRIIQAGGQDFFFDAQLTWRLDRLIFTSDELAIERLRRQRDADHASLVKRVLEALFDWHRAVVLSHDPDLDAKERELQRIGVLEAAVTLEVLTAGWFGAHSVEAVGR